MSIRVKVRVLFRLEVMIRGRVKFSVKYRVGKVGELERVSG